MSSSFVAPAMVGGEPFSCWKPAACRSSIRYVAARVKGRRRTRVVSRPTARHWHRSPTGATVLSYPSNMPKFCHGHKSLPPENMPPADTLLPLTRSRRNQ
jgi:hypothetical protein